MNDRELLELAAKAAGVPAYWSDDGSIQQRPIFVVKAGGAMGTMPYECPWNPLTDDADALRLAVKLNLGISIPVHETIRADVVCFRDSSVSAREYGKDPYAATRRAIVRAAAEIGKAMP